MSNEPESEYAEVIEIFLTECDAIKLAEPWMKKPLLVDAYTRLFSSVLDPSNARAVAIMMVHFPSSIKGRS